MALVGSSELARIAVEKPASSALPFAAQFRREPFAQHRPHEILAAHGSFPSAPAAGRRGDNCLIRRHESPELMVAGDGVMIMDRLLKQHRDPSAPVSQRQFAQVDPIPTDSAASGRKTGIAA